MRGCEGEGGERHHRPKVPLPALSLTLPLPPRSSFPIDSPRCAGEANATTEDAEKANAGERMGKEERWWRGWSVRKERRRRENLGRWLLSSASPSSHSHLIPHSSFIILHSMKNPLPSPLPAYWEREKERPLGCFCGGLGRSWKFDWIRFAHALGKALAKVSPHRCFDPQVSAQRHRKYSDHRAPYQQLVDRNPILPLVGKEVLRAPVQHVNRI